MNKLTKSLLGFFCIALLAVAATPHTIETDDDIYTIWFSGELKDKWINGEGEHRIDVSTDTGTYHSYFVTEEQYNEIEIGEKYLYITFPDPVIMEM